MLKTSNIIATSGIVLFFIFTNGCENSSNQKSFNDKIFVSNSQKTDLNQTKFSKTGIIPEKVLAKKEKKIEKPFTYNPKSRLDPFGLLPIELYESNNKKNLEKNEKLTPLQGIELSRLKLVAIVSSNGVAKAMVQDATGRGYVVSKGSYISAGKVIRILKDRIVIEEINQTPYGKIAGHERVLRFIKD